MNLNRLRALVRDESGQSSTEYAILLAWLSLSLIIVLSTLGNRVHGVFDNIARQLDTLADYT